MTMYHIWWVSCWASYLSVMCWMTLVKLSDLFISISFLSLLFWGEVKRLQLQLLWRYHPLFTSKLAVFVYYVCCLLKAILNLNIFYYTQMSLSNELRLLFPGLSQYCLLWHFLATQTIQLLYFLSLPFSRAIPFTSFFNFIPPSGHPSAAPSLRLSGSD